MPTTTKPFIQIIAVASKNPAKLIAVESAFQEAFPDRAFTIQGYAVDSGVPDQPLSDTDTLKGARTRVSNTRKCCPNADYWVGLEAGIEGRHTYAWMVVEGKNSIGAFMKGEASSARLPLPPAALSLIKEGKELGDVMDQLFGTHNIKQQGGAIGLLTRHLLTRSSVYHQALILALIPFLNEELFAQ